MMNGQEKKLNQLENKVQQLEQFIAENRKAFESKPAVEVKGSLEIKAIKTIPISLSQLIKIYNDVPKILEEYLIGVNLTEESYRQQNKSSILLAEAPRANYWIIATEENQQLNYWLFPNGNITINLIRVTSIRSLFEFQGQELTNSTEYIVEKPAEVLIMPNGKQWQLKKQGILYLGRKNTTDETSSETQNKSSEKSLSMLVELLTLVDQGEKERQELKQQIVKLFQEKSQDSLKISQLSQETAKFQSIITELNLKISELNHQERIDHQTGIKTYNYSLENEQFLHEYPTLPKKKYAGFWRRVLAALIDSIPIIIIGFVIAVGSSLLYDHLYFEMDYNYDTANVISFIVFIPAFIVSIWLYSALMESSALQATLGKLVTRIIVTDVKGKRISFGKATARFFGKIISVLTIGIGFIMVGITRKKQGLHDKMAGCLVLTKKEEG